MPDLDDLKRLRLIYEQSLGRGPFPTEECHMAGFEGKLRLELDLYLSQIAGIASHGEKLRDITPERRGEFLQLSSGSFCDLFPSPEIQQSITLKRTPNLLRLLEDTENARQLILECLE